MSLAKFYANRIRLQERQYSYLAILSFFVWIHGKRRKPLLKAKRKPYASQHQAFVLLTEQLVRQNIFICGDGIAATRIASSLHSQNCGAWEWGHTLSYLRKSHSNILQIPTEEARNAHRNVFHLWRRCWGRYPCIKVITGRQKCLPVTYHPKNFAKNT